MHHNHDTICLTGHRIVLHKYQLYTCIAWYTETKYVVAGLLYEHNVENNRINLVNTSINQPV